MRADKGHVWRTVLHYGGGDIHINVIVMIVGCQHGIDLTDGERIEDKRRGAQVRLQLLHPRHTLHLMPFLHQRITVALLAGPAPEVDTDIRATLGFQPDPGTAQPPHGKGAWRNLLLFNLFIQPGSPFREGAEDP
ncbi:hypothetical protein D3C76_1427620 [compost metagenome]